MITCVLARGILPSLSRLHCTGAAVQAIALPQLCMELGCGRASGSPAWPAAPGCARCLHDVTPWVSQHIHSHKWPPLAAYS